jgi:hypothetical protein
MLTGEFVNKDNEPEMPVIDMAELDNKSRTTENKFIVKKGDIRFRVRLKVAREPGDGSSSEWDWGHSPLQGRRGYASWLFTKFSGQNVLPVIVLRKIQGIRLELILWHEETINFDDFRIKIERENNLLSADADSSEKFAAYSARDSREVEILQSLDYVTGNTDRQPANLRYGPDKHIIGSDEDMAFLPCSQVNFSVGYHHAPTDDLLPETKEFIRSLNFENIAKAGKIAGIERISAIAAMLRLNYLQSHFDVLKDDDSRDASLGEIKNMYSGGLAKEIDEALRTVEFPGEQLSPEAFKKEFKDCRFPED